MEITKDRFQQVLLDQQINVEGNLFTKSLDVVPKTLWQSFLIWIETLLKKADKDQFDMLPLALNIDAVVNDLDSAFFNEIEPEQIQQGIDNLNALKAKFLSNPVKGARAEIPLKRAIHKLEQMLNEKMETARKQEEDRKLTMFFQSEETNQVFKKHLPLLAKKYTDCVSCFGMDSLKASYADTPELLSTQPAIFWGRLKLKKEKFAEVNQSAIKEIRRFFTKPDEALPLLFPAYKGSQIELSKTLSEGHITFTTHHMNLLNRVIQSPEAVAKNLKKEITFFEKSPQEIEEDKILEGLLKLRNDNPYQKKMDKHRVEPIVARQDEPPVVQLETALETVQTSSNGNKQMKVQSDFTLTENIENKASQFGSFMSQLFSKIKV